MELSGSAVLVTGGTGGLGEAAVRRFHAAGAGVVIMDVAEDRAVKFAEDLGNRAIACVGDVLDSDAVQGAVHAAAELGTLRTVVVAHGGPGVAERIVNRAGAPAPLENFVCTVQAYLTGTYNVVRLGAAAMARNVPLDDVDGARGVVITTASIAAYEGQVGQAAYAVAKGGVVSLTLAAARDLSSVGVRVCCIAPGTIRTPAMEGVGEDALAGFGASVPFPKRLGKPQEYAALAHHIAENDYLNGEVIRLDGAQRFGPK
jgi:NAD(P)-dependent dehydrogenase (short-subunit alcohol dehydrogenase family)